MNKSLKNIYDHLPAMLQNAILTSYSIKLDRSRYGGNFHELRRFLAKSQFYTSEELIDYQNEQLAKIVFHAYTTVPYYRDLFDKHSLKPDDIQTVNDLYKLPVLSRKDIIRNFDALRSRSYKPSQLVIGHTSGTTGSPLEVYYDSNMLHMTYAVLDRQYDWAKVKLKKFGDKVAILRGNIIVPIEQKRPPFWRYNYLHNQLFLSSFHLSKHNMDAYISEIMRYKPLVLDGYPSTLYVLAKYLMNIGQKIQLKAALTSSETLYETQREIIEDSFQCKVFDYYGAAERVMFATECDRHEGHHINSEYGITEFLNKDNEPVSAGETGYVVGTSLHNFGMPLLRYKTSDLTALKLTSCSCGRMLPLMQEITTKAEDSISLKDGRIISPSVLTHPFKPMHSVESSQIVQDDYDHVIIKIVPNEAYTEEDTKYLISEFTKRLGEDVKVDVLMVNELDRSASGKFKWVVSHVNMAV